MTQLSYFQISEEITHSILPPPPLTSYSSNLLTNMDTSPASDDYDGIIHYDARHGHKDSLEVYLKHKPECINKLYRYGEFEWTVLLAACYYQHAEIVEMLVTQFKADIEAEGTIVISDGNGSPLIIEGASPLWTAAIVNNFQIVKFLVQYGSANVNHLTEKHSAPLRAACYKGNLEMVRFLIQYGADPNKKKLGNCTHLILVVSHHHISLVTYFVDNLKCDLNEADDEGRTALHFAVGRGFLDITQLLISRGALNLLDKSKNITPLIWAAVHGKTDFVNAFDGHCSDIEWIEAREILGSIFAGCRSDIENMDSAVENLTLALEARANKNIPKLCSDQTSKVFDHRRECQTRDDLHQLVSLGSTDALYFEALLIQERLLGTKSKYYHQSLSEVGNAFISKGQYDVCFRLWFYELDLCCQHQMPLKRVLLDSFVTLFDHLLAVNKTQIFINGLRQILTVITDELSSSQDDQTFDYDLVILLQLLTVSAHLLLNENIEKEHRMSVEDGKLLLKHIRSIVRKNYVTTNSGSSLLHLCCNENTETSGVNIIYPCLMTVRLLVFCGIDVDAMDSFRNTALHILVQNSSDDDSMAIIDFLCNNTNAHVDFADNDGNSPIEYSSSTVNHTQTKIRRLQQHRRVTSLKCRCARLAKYARLHYEECLSSSLVKFVYKH